jgi:serine protease Do
MKDFVRLLCVLSCLGMPGSGVFGAEADFEKLFEERIRSVVAVEFFIETEIDRRPSGELGLVANDEGLIVMQESALPGWIPPEQLKEFKVFPLRSHEEFAADYLGQDNLTGWHFLRVRSAGFRERVTPVTAYPVQEPRLGQEVWGFAVMGKEFDFEPYFLISRFSLWRSLPQDLAFTVSEVSSPGSLVFTAEGDLLGWATSSYLRESILHIGDERIPVALQGSRESGSFLPAHEVLPYLDRVPADPRERNMPWIGITSLQPLEREVAAFLGLENRGGVIISEVIPGTPAAEADVQQGDVVVAVDGDPIPYYRPHHASPQHLHLEILRRKPGDRMRLSLIRGTEELEREVEIAPQPATVREARRQYFTKLGVTLREFLVFDGMARRVGPEPERGLVVQFVRPNSPAHSGGLATGDWIMEVNGAAVSSYDEAVQLVARAEESADRREVVFLISRQNETSVVRVRMR